MIRDIFYSILGILAFALCCVLLPIIGLYAVLFEPEWIRTIGGD